LKSELFPGHVFLEIKPGFLGFIGCDEIAGQALSHIDHHHRHPSGIGVDAEESPDARTETALLFRLPERCSGYFFSAVHIPAGKDPLSSLGIDVSLEKHDAAVHLHYGTGYHLGIEVENKVTPGADKALRFLLLEGQVTKASPTNRTESKFHIFVHGRRTAFSTVFGSGPVPALVHGLVSQR
jgi:hypothetical protein